MITWNDLTAEQQQVLEMLPVSVLPNQRELYDAHKGVIHQLVEMHLARPTLTTYKRITDGDYVLAQKPAQKPAQQPANDSGAAVDVSALQAENAFLKRAVDDLTEITRRIKAEVAKLWDTMDASIVVRDYRFISETLNEIEAMLEEVVDDE